MERVYVSKRPRYQLEFSRARQFFENVAADTLLFVQFCLYKRLPGKTLADHLEGVKAIKHHNDKEKIKKMKMHGEEYISYFDIGLLYKIINDTCLLSNESADVWKQDFKKALLEVKEGRNLFAHREEEVLDKSDFEFDEMMQKLRKTLKFLIYEAQRRSDVTVEDADKKFAQIEIEFQLYSKNNVISNRELPSTVVFDTVDDRFDNNSGAIVQEIKTTTSNCIQKVNIQYSVMDLMNGN